MPRPALPLCQSVSWRLVAESEYRSRHAGAGRRSSRRTPDAGARRSCDRRDSRRARCRSHARRCIRVRCRIRGHPTVRGRSRRLRTIRVRRRIQSHGRIHAVLPGRTYTRRRYTSRRLPAISSGAAGRRTSAPRSSLVARRSGVRSIHGVRRGDSLRSLRVDRPCSGPPAYTSQTTGGDASILRILQSGCQEERAPSQGGRFTQCLVHRFRTGPQPVARPRAVVADPRAVVADRVRGS